MVFCITLTVTAFTHYCHRVKQIFITAKVWKSICAEGQITLCLNKIITLGRPRRRTSRCGLKFRFADPEVCALCNSGRQMRQTLGADTAKIVQRLLRILEAAPSVSGLSSQPPIRRRQIDETDPPQFSVGMPGTGQVLFQQTLETGSNRSPKISCITILTIGGTV